MPYNIPEYNAPIIYKSRSNKLITALHTAVDNDGVLDKEATSYNDIFDAFRLALKFYHLEIVAVNTIKWSAYIDSTCVLTPTL
jgi:hypothetical protein